MKEFTTFLSVSRRELLENAQAIIGAVSVPVIGVVKCGGYGISVTEAAAVWCEAGVTMLAVSKPQEALTLREAGFTEEILLLAPVAHPETIRAMIENNIILTVTGTGMAALYTACGENVRVHVAVDTGLGRFGIRWTDAEQFAALYGMKGLHFEGIFSHFAQSFEPVFSHTKLQLERFQKLTDTLAAAGYPIGIRHIANSCAALRFPQTHLDAVRVGAGLIGRLPAAVPVKLHKAGTFHAQVVDVKQLQAGDTTGYAAMCHIRQDTRAVVVATGIEYGFGFLYRPDHFGLKDMVFYLLRLLRQCLQRPYVTFGGRQLPLIGRIGTQYTLFEAGDAEIHPGDFVELHVSFMFPRSNTTVHITE